VKVRFSDEARDDLRRIGDYIARESPVRARDFVRELRQRAMQLADNPLAFALVPRHEHSGIRRRVFRNYLIF
jgi:plasmid stabilization system protein ParE